MIPESKTFKAWWEEFVRFGREELLWSEKSLALLPAEEFREMYFDEGLTPSEAWAEEYSAAQ